MLVHPASTDTPAITYVFYSNPLAPDLCARCFEKTSVSSHFFAIYITSIFLYFKVKSESPSFVYEQQW